MKLENILLQIILFVNIGDIILLLSLSFGVANVIDIEAQGFGEVVEAVKLNFFLLHKDYRLYLIKI